MKNIDFILNKLRHLTNSKTDKELCEILDINYSTLDTWKNNDNIPKKRLLEFSQKLDISFDELSSHMILVLKNEIKINDTLLEQAKNEASKFGLDISGYLEHLIIQDLKK